MSCIKEAEYDTKYSDKHHRPPTPQNERKAYNTCQHGGQRDSQSHMADTHPSLCTGALGTKARRTVVGAFEKVVKIIDEVGVDLHDEGKEEAQDGGLNIER